MDSELYHHGILGQKWGIRRYQNKDGTLTDEGKQRRANEVAKQLIKDKYSWGNNIENTKSFKMLTDLITTDQLKSLQDSREQLNKTLSENKYDADAMDREASSLLKANEEKYYSQAETDFKRIEGYNPTPEEVEMDAFDLAYKDVLKMHPDIDKKDMAISKAVDEHMNLMETIVNNSLIGEYGEMRINPKKQYSEKIRYAIGSAISVLDSKPLLVNKIIGGR